MRKLNLKPLAALGMDKADLVQILSAISPVAYQLVYTQIVKDLSMSDLKSLQKEFSASNLSKDEQAKKVAALYRQKTGRSINELGQAKMQAMVNILADSLKQMRQQASAFSSLPEGAQDKIMQAVQNKNWRQLAALLGQLAV